MVTPTHRAPQVPAIDPHGLLTLLGIQLTLCMPRLCPQRFMTKRLQSCVRCEDKPCCQGPKRVPPPGGLAAGPRASTAKGCPLPTGGHGVRHSGSAAGRSGPRLTPVLCDLLYTEALLMGPTGALAPTTSQLGRGTALGLLVWTWTPNHRLSSWPDPHLPHHCASAVTC